MLSILNRSLKLYSSERKTRPYYVFGILRHKNNKNKNNKNNNF